MYAFPNKSASWALMNSHPSSLSLCVCLCVNRFGPIPWLMLGELIPPRVKGLYEKYMLRKGYSSSVVAVWL